MLQKQMIWIVRSISVLPWQSSLSRRSGPKPGGPAQSLVTGALMDETGNMDVEGALSMHADSNHTFQIKPEIQDDENHLGFQRQE